MSQSLSLTDLIDPPKRPIERIARNDLTLQLLMEAEQIALDRYNGQLTIFRLTSRWIVMFGTPKGSELAEKLISSDSHHSLHEALRVLVNEAKAK